MSSYRTAKGGRGGSFSGNHNCDKDGNFYVLAHEKYWNYHLKNKEIIEIVLNENSDNICEGVYSFTQKKGCKAFMSQQDNKSKYKLPFPSCLFSTGETKWFISDIEGNKGPVIIKPNECYFIDMNIPRVPKKVIGKLIKNYEKFFKKFTYNRKGDKVNCVGITFKISPEEYQLYLKDVSDVGLIITIYFDKIIPLVSFNDFNFISDELKDLNISFFNKHIRNKRCPIIYNEIYIIFKEIFKDELLGKETYLKTYGPSPTDMVRQIYRIKKNGDKEFTRVYKDKFCNIPIIYYLPLQTYVHHYDSGETINGVPSRYEPYLALHDDWLRNTYVLFSEREKEINDIYKNGGGAWRAETPPTTPSPLSNQLINYYQLFDEKRNDPRALMKLLRQIIKKCNWIVLENVIKDCEGKIDRKDIIYKIIVELRFEKNIEKYSIFNRLIIYFGKDEFLNSIKEMNCELLLTLINSYHVDDFIIDCYKKYMKINMENFTQYKNYNLARIEREEKEKRQNEENFFITIIQLLSIINIIKDKYKVDLSNIKLFEIERNEFFLFYDCLIEKFIEMNFLYDINFDRLINCIDNNKYNEEAKKEDFCQLKLMNGSQEIRDGQLHYFQKLYNEFKESNDNRIEKIFDEYNEFRKSRDDSEIERIIKNGDNKKPDYSRSLSVPANMEQQEMTPILSYIQSPLPPSQSPLPPPRLIRDAIPKIPQLSLTIPKTTPETTPETTQENIWNGNKNDYYLFGECDDERLILKYTSYFNGKELIWIDCKERKSKSKKYNNKMEFYSYEDDTDKIMKIISYEYKHPKLIDAKFD